MFGQFTLILPITESSHCSVHSLAYAGMPLVLSAIDLKLSPSYSEMLTRRSRLDAFAQIIHKFRDLYEITDVVAAGTNQILQLTYAITKKLFLSKRMYVWGRDRATCICHFHLSFSVLFSPSAFIFYFFFLLA